MPGFLRGFTTLRFFFVFSCLFCNLAAGLPLPVYHTFASSTEAVFPALLTDGMGFRRVGEASNPGPAGRLLISTSNPSGLRGKEALIAEHPEGIHCLSETQLSAVSVVPSRKSIQREAFAQQRHVRVITGHPAPLRSGSLWAGSWSGVLQASDYPCRELALDWPPALFHTGRVVCAQHFVGSQVLTLVTVYGYAPGPTWPDAKSRTNEILTHITKEVVFGGRGVRIVVGDFNHAPASLPEIQTWRAQGWTEAQEVAADWWAQPVQATCKGSTTRDFIWMSPEAQALLQSVQVREVFQEHSTVQIELGVSSATVRPQVWPLPSAIPWSSIKLEAWHSAGHHNPLSVCDSSEWFSRFGHAVERSLQGFVEEAPGKHLPTKCFGRGKRLKPQSQTQAVPPKPSRPGEVTLRHDLLGAEVLRWFRQLRRLQSLVHSLRSNNDAATAQVYRLDLWRAILHGKGFRGGFMEWWRNRRVRLAGSPNAVPLALPGRVLAEAIYLDFRANFRDFESWHLRQRSQQLQARYDKTQKQLYLELRGDAPPQVDTLTLHHVHEVVKAEPSQQLVTLATEPDDRGASLWTLEGAPVAVVEVNHRHCTLQTDVFPAPGQVLEQVQTLHSTADVQSEFIRLWSARWLKHRDKTPQDWTRVLAFSRAFLPSSPFVLPPISLEDWNQALRRFKPTAARGPDGWAKEDLLNLPPSRSNELLALLMRIEQGEAEWPSQLLQGFVILLSKQNGKLSADGFRPICLYSIIFRTWSGIRARQLLGRLRTLITHESYGFLPDHEATELWYSVQAHIEVCCQTGFEANGLSTDLVKAFNNLPRFPLLAIAAWVGFPANIIRPWTSFLARTSRRCQIHQSVSPEVLSTSGFPEGDPICRP